MQAKYTITEAFFDYDVKFKTCSNGRTVLTKYKRKISRKKDGFEKPLNEEIIPDLSDKKEKSKKVEGVIRPDSLSRSRTMLIDYASEYESEWKSFITLTFAENMKDLTKANSIFNDWCRKVQRIFPEFVYLGVPELQKRGAWHYHILSNLVPGSLVIPRRPEKRLWNPEKKEYKIIEFYDLKYWGSGYSTAFDLNLTDDKFNCALYVTKYLYKDISSRLFGRRKVLHSQKMRKPQVYYLSQNSAVYLDAWNYIKEKGYSVSDYEPVIHNQYQIPCVVSSTQLEQSDYNTVSDILNNR